MLRHASLFSGIGGFDLAADWMGWENVFHCEIDQFCQRVLKYHFPNTITYADIKLTDFTIHRGQIDVLTGGFPCQPYSTAGKRKGKEDDRHLWPEMLRAIREIQPGYVVGENVRGLTNWNGGMVFDEVQAGLENEGYEVLPFLLPACGVDAPHRRDRIWFVAHSNSNSQSTKSVNDKSGQRELGVITNSRLQRPARSEQQTTRIEQCNKENITNTKKSDKQRDGVRKEQGESEIRGRNTGATWSDQFPTQSPVCGGNDGLPSELDGITFPKWRNKSLQGYGNAVVPVIPFRLFQAIQSMI